MLRELFEANHEGHRKGLSDEHLQTIFDAVAHDEFDMERLKEMSSELGDGEDYDRTPGGAYFALMRMYLCVHGEPPEGKIVGKWYQQVPPNFIAFAEDNGIHNAHENVIKGGGIADHKLHQQKEEKGAAKAAKAQEIADAKNARQAERDQKAHGKKVSAAQQHFNDRWPTIRATISPQKIRKEVEAAKDEIFHDIAKGMSIHAAVAKVVSAHGGIMEAQKFTFVNFLVEGVVNAADRFAAKKATDDEKKTSDKKAVGRARKQELDDAKHTELRAKKAAREEADHKRRGTTPGPKVQDTRVGPTSGTPRTAPVVPKRQTPKLSIVEGDVVDASDRFSKKTEDDELTNRAEAYNTKRAEERAEKEKKDKVWRDRDSGNFQRQQDELKVYKEVMRKKKEAAAAGDVKEGVDPKKAAKDAAEKKAKGKKKLAKDADSDAKRRFSRFGDNAPFKRTT